MFIRKGTSLMLMLIAGVLLSAFVLPGCGREQNVVVQPAAPAPAPVATTRVAGPTIVRQAERDYWVDSRGALHQIVRQESVAGGGIYYLQGDERGWYLDQGGRLYYREPAGRVVYYEDVMTGGTVYTTPVNAQTCESQWRSCVAGCDSISSRQRYDRTNCMQNCDAIRSGCLGR